MKLVIPAKEVRVWDLIQFKPSERTYRISEINPCKNNFDEDCLELCNRRHKGCIIMNLRSEVILVARPWTNGRTARHMKDAIDNAIACAVGYDRIQEVLNEYFLGLEYDKLVAEIEPPRSSDVRGGLHEEVDEAQGDGNVHLDNIPRSERK